MYIESIIPSEMSHNLCLTILLQGVMEQAKSKNQIKNEEKNRAKMEKFLAKQEKLKEQVFCETKRFRLLV